MGSRPTRPNVIWVFADQMRGSAMSCASTLNGPNQNVHTPNLDAMAARGVRFENACATNPVCMPFRFSLLTGQYSSSRTMPNLGQSLSPAERTIAHEMNEAGYRTGYFGKWHLRGKLPNPHHDRWGLCVPEKYRGGFRNWHGFENNNDCFETWIQHGDDATPTHHEGYQTDVLFDQLIADLESGPAEPFFSVLSFVPPHPPYRAPEANLTRQRERRLVHRPNVRPPGDRPFADPDEVFRWDYEGWLENLDEHARHYYAMVENADDNMGRLYEALERTGQLANTYVFFFADHGEMLGSQHRMGKCMPFEESAHIPLIVTGPDIPAGEGRAAPTCTEDLHPTTCGLAGIEPADALPGRDLSAYLRDGRPEPDRAGVMLGNGAWRAFRTRRYSLTALKHECLWLFDLERDPYQQQNLVDDPSYAEILREMAHALERGIVETEDFFEFEAARALSSGAGAPASDA